MESMIPHTDQAVNKWEKVVEECSKVGEALGNMVAALSDWAAEALENFGEVLYQAVSTDLAYTKAGKYHPEWVHKARYSKKKRIRKKYHNKILKDYGG